MNELEKQIEARQAQLDSVAEIREKLLVEAESLTRAIASDDLIVSIDARARRNAVREAISDSDARLTKLREAVAALEEKQRKREAEVRIGALLERYLKLRGEIDAEGRELANRVAKLRSRYSSLCAIWREAEQIEERELGRVSHFPQPLAFGRDDALENRPWRVVDLAGQS